MSCCHGHGKAANNGTSGGHEAGHGDGGHTMWMWYHTELNDTVLFEFWTVHGVTEMLITCLVLFVAAVGLEALKRFRLELDCRLPSGSTHATKMQAHFIQTLLFAAQIVLSYLLMLAVMSFSVWIIVSICAGAAVGFYLFGTVRNGTASTSSTPKMMNQASGGRRTDERLSIDPIH